LAHILTLVFLGRKRTDDQRLDTPSNHTQAKEVFITMTGKKKPRTRAGMAIVFFTILLFAALMENTFAAEATPDCNIHESSCTKTIGTYSVKLDIHPKPVTAMQDLTFRVSVTGGAISQTPYIDLGMPGMHMGPNRVDLKPSTTTSYQGQGVIVRCPSGKRIWRATVTLPSIGKVDFTFDVVY
jgi:hypothetical protein